MLFFAAFTTEEYMPFNSCWFISFCGRRRIFIAASNCFSFSFFSAFFFITA